MAEKRSACVLIAMAMAMASPVCAGTLLQNGVAVSGLKATLSDLKPSDGKAASIQWMVSENSSASTGLMVSSGGFAGTGSRISGGVMGGLLEATEDGSVELPNAQAGKMGLNQFASVSMTTADALGELSHSNGLATNEVAYRNFSSMAAVIPRQSYYTGNTFTLGAHSQLTLSGTLSFDKLLDVRELAQSSVLSETLGAGRQVHFASEAGIYLSLRDPSGTSYPSDAERTASFVQSLGGYFNIDKTWVELPSSSDPKIFSFTVTNDTDAAITRELGFTTLASMSLRVQAIPEPSTWALMGLGLVGIASVVRRQRLTSR